MRSTPTREQRHSQMFLDRECCKDSSILGHKADSATDCLMCLGTGNVITTICDLSPLRFQVTQDSQ